jgi:dihydroorotase (multifunctional complex type)
MSVDLLVSGGTLVTAAGQFRADLAVRDGRIAAIGSVSASAAGTVIDATGLHVFPGFVDAHVHLRDPGAPEEEDFASGTAAAAFGGITTVIDMPNTDPPPVDAPSFEDKAAHVGGRAHVDFALTGLVAASSGQKELCGLIAAGAVGLNAFNGVPVHGAEPAGDGRLWEQFTLAREHDVPLGVLGENQDMVARARQLLDGADALTRWIEARTDVAEVVGTASAVSLAAATRTRVHVNHLASGAALDVITRFRRGGARVTCETSPHYLLLSREVIGRDTGLAAVSPPMRSAADGERMWAALRSGEIDILVSDHAPHAEEALTRPELWNPAVTGFSGIELTVPLMVTAAARGLVRLEQLAWVLAEAPARLFGLHPVKGALRIGADADLTLVDLRQRRVVDPGLLHSRGRLTPFAGWTLTGWPRATIVRGRVVMSDGELVGTPGYGALQRKHTGGSES